MKTESLLLRLLALGALSHPKEASGVESPTKYHQQIQQKQFCFPEYSSIMMRFSCFAPLNIYIVIIIYAYGFMFSAMVESVLEKPTEGVNVVKRDVPVVIPSYFCNVDRLGDPFPKSLPQTWSLGE